MYKNIQKETQNHAITRISLYSCDLKRLTSKRKNNYNSSVLLKFFVLETDKKLKTLKD